MVNRFLGSQGSELFDGALPRLRGTHAVGDMTTKNTRPSARCDPESRAARVTHLLRGLRYARAHRLRFLAARIAEATWVGT